MTLKLLIISALLIQLMVHSSSSLQQDDFITAARAFTDLMVKKDYTAAEAQFDETMKTAMPHGKLEETWNGLQLQAGAFKQQGKSRTEKRGAYTMVFITCDFEKTKLDVRVVLDESKHVAGLFFGPATNVDYSSAPYAKPEMFREKEIVIGEGEWKLPGTLSLPVGTGPFPAVVLVHGSGPNDRDETISVNKPFRDLAEGLASRGVAVLRYDKRSKVHGSKFGSSFTVKEEVLDDALAAVALLRSTEGIDPKRIFVLGHSLGGMMVPRIGKLDPNIAGLISLAGATRHLEDVIPAQYEYLFSLDGSLTKEEQDEIDKQKQLAAEVKALKPGEPGTAKFLFGAPTAYWLDLRDYEPPQLAKTLKQPMLILQGERDYQVTMDDFNNWKTALASNKNATFKTYPELNHLFMSGTGKGNPSEYDQAGHVDVRVIDDIAGWIAKRL
jgi:dienelactone hydrolase